MIICRWLDQNVLCGLEVRQARSNHSRDYGYDWIMNGLAIIITATQMPTFQRCDAAALFVDCTVDDRE
jgi:hypothetical protein